MELLFLKINNQAIQNFRYKSKNGPNSHQRPEPSIEDFRPARGSSVQDPIDLESEPVQPERPSVADRNRSETLHETQTEYSEPVSTGRCMQRADDGPRDTEPDPQPALSSSGRGAQAADPYAVPDSPALSPTNGPTRKIILHHSRDAQTSNERLPNTTADSLNGRRAANTEPVAVNREGLTSAASTSSSSTKRAAAENAQSLSKKRKMVTSKSVTSKKKTPKTPKELRRSMREKKLRHTNLDEVAIQSNSDLLAGEPRLSAEPAETAQVSEAVHTTPEAAAARVADFMVDDSHHVSSTPCTESASTQAPQLTTAGEVVQDQLHQQIPQPVLTELASQSPPTTEAREEQILQEIAIEDSGLPTQTEWPTATPDALAANPTTEAEAAVTVPKHANAFTPLRTAGEKAQTNETLPKQRARVPEAQMGVPSNTGVRGASSTRQQTSPPPPDMGFHEWLNGTNLPTQSTVSGSSSVCAHSERVGAPHTTSPDPVSSHGASASIHGERNRDEGAKNEEKAAMLNQKSMTRESEQCSAEPTAEKAAKSELRLIAIGQPKSARKTWKPSVPFKNLTMAKIKAEIPLSLSPDFRGFKFTLVGAGQRNYWELQEGEDYELGHLKLDVETIIEDWEMENEEKDEYLILQLRIEELTGENVKASPVGS